METEACAGCEMTMNNFFDFSLDSNKLSAYLIKHGVVPGSKNCPKCGSKMTLTEGGRHLFRCKKRIQTLTSNRKKISKHCDTAASQYKDTLLQKCRLGIRKMCIFIAVWMLMSPSEEFFAAEFEMARETLLDWFHCLWNVCVHDLSSNLKNIGGLGKTVEIYEAKVLHRNCRCGKIVNGNWVFGFLERGSQNCFLVVVEKRGQEILLPIIKAHVMPGTTLVSDSWRTYNCLNLEGYQQLCVNNCLNFVHPDSGGVRAKGIIGTWREVYSLYGLSRFGNSEQLFHYHIAEFLFRYKYPVHEERLHNLFTAIGKSYIENDALVMHNDGADSSGLAE